jgi:hypothetical protein
MNAPEKPSLLAANRNVGIDALRASLTLLVVFHHAAITYGAIGSWFYKEIEPSSAPSSLILTLFVAYNQAFFMGLFFLIAGSLTPGAIARHGADGFLRERLMRLGAPLLVFILTLGPITVALAETAHGRPFLATLGWLARRGAIIVGPLWFVEALLIFCAAYVAVRAAIGPAQLERARPFPSNRVPPRFCCACAGRPARKSSGSRSAISPATSSCSLPAASAPSRAGSKTFRPSNS